MSSELADMYQDVIIENARRPHNLGHLDDATYVMQAHNPLCGDQLTLFLTLTGDTITDVAFEGSGCAISTASASMMTVAAKGLTRERALELFGHVHTMLTVDPEPGEGEPDVGKLVALSGVREYPTRVKCASLAWQALRGALTGAADRDGEVRTE
ncbi:MAG TPA: SUF system NifU family Fe-S cluster assembly protein [Micromonosporaceae bacterium]|jgi:nitrogen fixation NifU-like protein